MAHTVWTLEPCGKGLPEPHSISAEALVIGELIQAPELLEYLEARPEDFVLPAHRAMLEALLADQRDPGGPDVAQIIFDLGKRGVPAPFGFEGLAEYFIRLRFDVTPGRLGLPIYARKQSRVVRQKAFLRGASAVMARATSELERAAMLDDDPSSAVLDAAAALTALDTPDRETLVDYRTASSIVLNEIKSGAKNPGLRLGIADLDRLTNGIRPGELLVLGGLQGSGKTTVALQAACDVSFEQGLSALYCSLEMGGFELIERVFAQRASVSSTAIRTRMLTEEDVRSIERVFEMNRGHLHIDESGACSASRIATIARRVQARFGLDLVLVDHLQLMSSDNSRATEYETVTKSVHALKALAMHLACPVIVLSQVNREAVKVDGGRPRMRHLKGSGAIEQDADFVAMIWIEEPSDAGKSVGLSRRMRVSIEKNRAGVCDEFELIPRLEFFRVLDAAPRRYDGPAHGNGAKVTEIR